MITSKRITYGEDNGTIYLPLSDDRLQHPEPTNARHRLAKGKAKAPPISVLKIEVQYIALDIENPFLGSSICYCASYLLGASFRVAGSRPATNTS